MTTKKSKRTYNAPKGTKIIGFEMLNDGKYLLTFAEDIEEEFKIGDRVVLKSHSMKQLSEYNGFTYFSDMDTSNGSYIVIEEVKIYEYIEKQATIYGTNSVTGKGYFYPIEWLEHYNAEFKRGDILTAVGVGHDKSNMTFIYNHFDKYSGHFEALCGGVQINPATKKSQLRDTWFKYGFNKEKVRHATPSEIEQFDNDLKKIGKRWNRETLEIEDIDISEIVVDLPTACEYLKEPMPQNYAYDAETPFERKINAQIEFQMICRAWNKFDGFVVDFKDYRQTRYYPTIYSDGDISTLSTYKHISVNLACYSFQTEERAIQFGTQFKELFKTAMGIE